MDIKNIGKINIPLKINQNYFGNNSVIKELSQKDFDDIKTYKLKSKKCTLILFYAPWCGYCKEVRPIWEQLGMTINFLDICAVNCEKNKSLINKMNIDKKNHVVSFPTIYLYKNGEPKRKFNEQRTLKNLLKFSIC